MAQVTSQSACEYCRLSGEQELREVREFVMHNGSTFRVCHPHFERMSARGEDGKNGYEIAALENAMAHDRYWTGSGESAQAVVWRFPQWNSLCVVQDAPHADSAVQS